MCVVVENRRRTGQPVEGKRGWEALLAEVATPEEIANFSSPHHNTHTIDSSSASGRRSHHTNSTNFRYVILDDKCYDRSVKYSCEYEMYFAFVLHWSIVMGWCLVSIYHLRSASSKWTIEIAIIFSRREGLNEEVRLLRDMNTRLQSTIDQLQTDVCSFFDLFYTTIIE